MKLDKVGGKCIKKVKYIYIPEKENSQWCIVIKEEFVNGIYNYYIANEFVFGVKNRFSQKDLKSLSNNGYFDQWLNKEV